jgi:hypothetical protein
MAIAHRFEYATSLDPSLNYCLWPYPPQAPVEDKFRSINLLFQTFDYTRIDSRAFEIVEAIRDGIGPFRTVFGVKQVDKQIAWEFYFYDYKRRRRQVSISRVLAAISGYMPTVIEPNENLPYFMFSLDLNNSLATGQSSLDVVHMYVGNPGSTVSSGIAYAVRSDSTTLENFYFFFDAGSQLPDVKNKIASSALFDDTMLPIEAVLVPELRQCQTIKPTIASIFPAWTSISCNGSSTGSDIPPRSLISSETIAATWTICCSMSASITGWRQAHCAS